MVHINPLIAMGRYTFRYEPRGIVADDGEDLPNDEAAKAVAVTLARDLGKNRAVVQTERIVVLDEHGRVVHEQLLSG